MEVEMTREQHERIWKEIMCYRRDPTRTGRFCWIDTVTGRHRSIQGRTSWLFLGPLVVVLMRRGWGFFWDAPEEGDDQPCEWFTACHADHSEEILKSTHEDAIRAAALVELESIDRAASDEA